MKTIAFPYLIRPYEKPLSLRGYVNGGAGWRPPWTKEQTLKNMRTSNWIISPRFGVNIKIFELPPCCKCDEFFVHIIIMYPKLAGNLVILHSRTSWWDEDLIISTNVDLLFSAWGLLKVAYERDRLVPLTNNMNMIQMIDSCLHS